MTQEINLSVSESLEISSLYLEGFFACTLLFPPESPSPYSRRKNKGIVMTLLVYICTWHRLKI